MSASTKNITNSLKIDGMTCINCALNLEKSVKKAGVQQVHVNFASKELIFEQEASISDQAIQDAVKNAGFSIAKDEQDNPWVSRAISIFSFSVAIYFILIMFIPVKVPPLIDAALAGISLIIGFWKFGKGAFYSLKSGSANMYVLILLGATTSFLFSLYLMVYQSGSHLYFETTAVLIALVLIGDIIEVNAINKTVKSVNKLASDKVSNAKRIVNEQVEIVGVNSLKIGDSIQASLGDEIYTDGIITEGTALINEALITGESTPIAKKIGSTVLGGSTVIEGNVRYKVEKNAHLSAKAKINQLVQNASSQKASVQKLADKVSGIFVPLIIGIAILTFFLNFYALQLGLETSLIRSVAILVISCPCAMGLATPIAIMVGLGKMSKEGILVKNPDTFENFAGVKKILFDKTGTLTTGKFVVNNFQSFTIDETLAKRLIVSMEKKSSHPIAKSIVAFWPNLEDFPFSLVEELKGKGIKAVDQQGSIYILGSANFTKQDVQTGDLFLLKDNELIASLFIEDQLKDQVPEAIQFFKDAQIESVVLSGDTHRKCTFLANVIQAEVIGELTPEAKLAKIESMGNTNLAMLGDGINDAPSLAKVNVGISFADASNLAVQSSDVVLMRDDMTVLQKAYKISKLTYSTIQQNLFWAFAYNLVAIPLAAFGVINPMWAAFFMIFSDLVVVGNAFVLKARKV